MGPKDDIHSGEIIAEGTPEHVATVEKSYTGHYLKPMVSEENYRLPV